MSSSLSLSLPLPPCSGIIVIDDEHNKTILVCTDADNYSFPKGKRHKGETSLDAAWRELAEETGLTPEHVQLCKDFTIDEQSNRGNVATRYYVGRLVKEHAVIIFDAQELKKVEWMNIDTVFQLEKFKNRRKDILKDAIIQLQLQFLH